jgi:hypothetical protein
MNRAARRLTPWLMAFLTIVTSSRTSAQAEPAAEDSAYDPALDSEFPRLTPRMFDVVQANFEPSYVAYPFVLGGVEPLLVEANIAPHFTVHAKRWLFAIVLTPKILVRMFLDESSPVRTPSYMPRLSAYFWLDDTLPRHPAFYASVSLNHHSNGQDGPFFLPDGAINHQDGSFSTNYLELSLYSTLGRGNVFAWSSLSFEWHLDINQEPELEGRYGLYRLHLSSAVLSGLELEGGLSLRLTAIVDDILYQSDEPALKVLEHFPFSARYTMTIPGIQLGLYAAYFIGHDYYNIWFDRVANVLEVGISGNVGPTLMRDDARQ